MSSKEGLAEADGNRTRRRVRHASNGFEGRGRHQPTNASPATSNLSTVSVSGTSTDDERATGPRRRNLARAATTMRILREAHMRHRTRDRE